MALTKGVRVGLMKKVTFQQRLEMRERITQTPRGRVFQEEERADIEA